MAIRTVHLCADSFFTRPGAVLTDPSGWTNIARVRDGLDFVLATAGSAALSRFDVDLGAGNADLPTFLYVGQTNAGRLGVTILVSYSDDGMVWTPVVTYATAPSDCTSILLADVVPGAGAHRYWAVGFYKVSGLTGLKVGELMLGLSVTFSVHPDVDGFDPTDEALRVEAARTEAGHLAHFRFLGSRRRARIRVSYVDHVWTVGTAVGVSFGWFVDNYVLTGKPFVWAWCTGVPGPYLRDHFVAKCLNGVRRDFGDSYIAGQRMVQFDLVGTRNWGTY